MAGGAADGLYTYDILLADGGPRVPDADDLGGVAILNGSPPPQKGAMRDGDMDNVQTNTLAGLVRLVPTCRVTVEYSAGYAVSRVDSMGTLVGSGDFAFTVNGTGDVTINWTDGALPPQGGKPDVRVTDAFGDGYGVAGVNEVRVHLKNSANSAAHLSFVLDIFG